MDSQPSPREALVTEIRLHLLSGLLHQVLGQKGATARGVEPRGCSTLRERDAALEPFVSRAALSPLTITAECREGGSPPLFRQMRKEGSERRGNLPRVTQVTGICNLVPLKPTHLTGFPFSPKEPQYPYPQSWKSWLARGPRRPGRPILPR